MGPSWRWLARCVGIQPAVQFAPVIKNAAEGICKTFSLVHESPCDAFLAANFQD